jgi:hypothetical protein
MTNKPSKRILAIVGCCFLAIAIAVGIPVSQRRPHHPLRAKLICVSRMKQIEGAKMQWMLERRQTTNDIPEWQDLVGLDGYLQEMPQCPSGGVYVIGKISRPPTCSVAEHNEFFRQ